MADNGRRKQEPEAAADAPTLPVLLADDDQRTLFSLREALADLRVDIVCVPAGREVLKQVLQRDFSVILLDVLMPDMDGYETAALIRERERSRHIPLIFITGQDRDVAQIFRGYSAGAVDYVFKPVDPFILRSKVSVFLNLQRQAESLRRQMLHSRELLKDNIRTRKANERYVQRLQHLSRQLMTLQDSERRNLARELHDEIGQCLTALNLNLQRIREGAGANGSHFSLMDDSLEIVRNLTRQVRDLSLEIHPTMLEDLGLEDALNWYVEHMRERTSLEIDCRFGLNGAKLSQDQSTACYRILQGAFTNVMRHAKATQVSIDLRISKANVLSLSIEDNGIGFDQEHVTRMIQQGRSFGLMALRERTALIGGTINIDTKVGHGTKVRLRFPLDKSHPT